MALTVPRILPRRFLAVLGLVLLLTGLASSGARDANPRSLTSGDGDWTLLTPPGSRYGHTAIYDPVRDRMIVFGGYDVISPSPYFNDVWALGLSGTPTWTRLAPVGTPPSGRLTHSAIYDPVRDRMIVFGGNDASGFLNDVWALSLSGTPTWTPLSPTGTPPSPREWHAAIYDPVRDRMVVHGGADGPFTFRSDTWALSLAGTPAWSELMPTGTVLVRAEHTAIYDPVRDRMIVFGGRVSTSIYQNDVRALSFAGAGSWSLVTPAGSPPAQRSNHSALYDPVRDRMVVFGGYNGTAYNDAWGLSLAAPTWAVLTPTGTPPTGREQHAAIYDPVRDRMVAFGGYNTMFPIRNDTWALSLPGTPAWTELAAGQPPNGRAYHVAIHDPVRDRMVIFGGYALAANQNDVWALSPSGIPAWTQLTPTGTPPPGRNYAAGIYDPVRDRIIVFGGRSSPSNYFADVWALSLPGTPAWTQLSPTGTPPTGRILHVAIYDPVRDRMLVFAGRSATVAYLNEVWALSLSGTPVWTQLSPTGTPPVGRYGTTAIYDFPRDRMVVFGGYDGTIGRNDLWALSLAGTPAWTQLSPSGTPPSGRIYPAAIYDPGGDWMLSFGGFDGVAATNDAWRLSLSGTPAWTLLAPTGTPPVSRYNHTAIFDPVRTRTVVFGGYDGTDFRNDTWALTSSAVVGVEPSLDLGTGLQLARPRPNPARGEVTFDFLVPEAAPVSITVLDVAGRVVKRMANRTFDPGPHSLVWDRTDDRGHPAGGGVYFVRLAAHGRVLVQRGVLLR